MDPTLIILVKLPLIKTAEYFRSGTVTKKNQNHSIFDTVLPLTLIVTETERLPKKFLA